MADYVQNGEIDQGECAELQAAAQADYERKLRAVLGDERYAALQGTDARAAGILRRDLQKLNVTNAQLKTALATQRQWDERRAGLDRQRQTNSLSDEAYEANIRAADAERDEGYRRALGSTGYDQLQKVQNAQYQTLKRCATAWELSDGDIDYLYQSLQTHQKHLADYQRRAGAMTQQGQPVDGPSVSRDLQQFSRQTRDTLRNYLGAERFNKLAQNDAFALED
jgi:hypothetical protein